MEQPLQRDAVRNAEPVRVVVDADRPGDQPDPVRHHLERGNLDQVRLTASRPPARDIVPAVMAERVSDEVDSSSHSQRW